MRDKILASIDVGSSKICTLVAELTPEEELRILGVGVTAAQGVKKGMVDNIQEATEAITSSVEKAERSSGSRVLAAHVLGGQRARDGQVHGVERGCEPDGGIARQVAQRRRNVDGVLRVRRQRRVRVEADRGPVGGDDHADFPPGLDGVGVLDAFEAAGDLLEFL